MEGGDFFDLAMNSSGNDFGPAVEAATNGMSSPRFKSVHPDSPTTTCGKFFELLTSSDFYKDTKVTHSTSCANFRISLFLMILKWRFSFQSSGLSSEVYIIDE